MEISDWQRANTVAGMYHWSTEENRDAIRFCAGCAHADPVRSRSRDLRKRARCGKLVEALKELGLKSKPRIIEAGTPACKYWEKRE